MVSDKWQVFRGIISAVVTPMHADEKPEKICAIGVIGGFVFKRLPATRRAGFYGPS